MTKKQKQAKVLELKEIIEAAGFEIDRWGNYKLQTQNGNLLCFVFKKNNLRFERKYSTGWSKIFSQVIVKVNVDNLKEILGRIENGK